ncbi:AAA family ATPase [Sinorhizobium fredii]|uniref:AAA family ATPase n=1 Tax=Rhizobium fredii TaxID=380 RepID=UPI0004ADFA26|nr:AAA family ATPase [Sinorhizobium fredii]
MKKYSKRTLENQVKASNPIKKAKSGPKYCNPGDAADLDLGCMANVKPKRVDWLWYPYIPYGAITVLYGKGGFGKSSFTVELAARLGNGEPLPSNSDIARREPLNILMLSAEDDRERIIAPRLENAGADLNKVFVPPPFVLVDNIDRLERLIEATSAKVVVIDPIVYFAGAKMDLNKSNEVRALMEKLKRIAEAKNIAVIVVGHVRKAQGGGSDQDQMSGSADWTNAARSGLFFSNTNDGTLVIKHSKANWGPKGGAMTYTIENREIEIEGEQTEINRFVFGEFIDVSALSPKLGRPAGGKKTEAAIAFLYEYLADGPKPQKEIEEAAAALDPEPITRGTLIRAKDMLGKEKHLEAFRSRSRECWMWRLT